LSVNINDFYMNEIWRHLIKPYGDIKRFVKAIITQNSTIRTQIDESIRGKKTVILTMYKTTTTEILRQIDVFLQEDNTQNQDFNNKILAIAFDLLFLPALFKRKDIATSGLSKSKEEYEETLKLLKVANDRISKFFKILDAKNKLFIGFNKLSKEDNKQIIINFQGSLCDDIAKQLYSEDIGKKLPQGKLRENVLKLFKLVRETFEQECDKCSTWLNCSGPKLVTFLEKSKEIKGLLDGGLVGGLVGGGIIGSVIKMISDLESKINKVIKSAAFSFDLYGVTSTFNEVNFDIVKDKLSRNTSEDISAKLNTQPDSTNENTENTNSRLAIYANALKNFQDKLPSFTVKAFNGVSMEKTSDAFRSATIEQRRQELKAQELDQQAKHELDLQKMKELTSIANAAAAPPNPTSGVAPDPYTNTAVPAPAAGSTAAVDDGDMNLEVVHVDDVHVEDADVNVNGPTNISIPTISPAASTAAVAAASNAAASTATVGGKTRRNKPKSNNKQSRKQNKVIYRIPNKSSSYKFKIGTTNSAKSKNTRRRK
jgi:hypothetical protein